MNKLIKFPFFVLMALALVLAGCEKEVDDPPVDTPDPEPTPTTEGYLSQDWSSENIFNGGWTTQLVVGSTDWETSSAGNPDNAPYASISNYNGSGNDPSEAWLISPSVDLTDATSPVLTFISAVGYFGDPMEVYASSNYDGTSEPSTADWIQLNAVVANNDDFFTWFDSGDVDLSEFNGGSMHIAFKYIGSGESMDGGATWEVDDILIDEM